MNPSDRTLGREAMSLCVTMALTLTAFPLAAQRPPLPVIDMHLHASTADANGPPPLALCMSLLEHVDHVRDPRTPWPDIFIGWQKKPPCKDPVWSPPSDDSLMRETIAAVQRRNIIGVLSGRPERVQRWMQAAPGRFIPGLQFQFGDQEYSPDSVRRLHSAGRFAVFAEVSNQYVGITPSDPRFEPYLALAEELDIPVGIHIGVGPPGAPYLGPDRYRAALHSPFTLEEALVRHPKLRVYIMHAAWPMLDELLAVLWTHPQVYVEVGAIVFALPRAELYKFLQRIVEAGFSKRIMFGTDQMVWPGLIERAIKRIESAPFLSESQKRDVLYNNAARFLRLSEAEIAKHHGR